MTALSTRYSMSLLASRTCTSSSCRLPSHTQARLRSALESKSRRRTSRRAWICSRRPNTSIPTTWPAWRRQPLRNSPSPSSQHAYQAERALSANQMRPLPPCRTISGVCSRGKRTTSTNRLRRRGSTMAAKQQGPLPHNPRNLQW